MEISIILKLTDFFVVVDKTVSICIADSLSIYYFTYFSNLKLNKLFRILLLNGHS